MAIGWMVQSPSDPEVAAIGQPAPLFEAELIEGGVFTLEDSAGSPVVINFWASWCIPCRAEIPEISAFAASHAHVDVIGIAVEDTEAKAREFAAQINAGFPLALGTDEIDDAYPRIGLPVTYVLDADLNVVEIFNGILNAELLADLVKNAEGA